MKLSSAKRQKKIRKMAGTNEYNHLAKKGTGQWIRDSSTSSSSTTSSSSLDQGIHGCSMSSLPSYTAKCASHGRQLIKDDIRLKSSYKKGNSNDVLVLNAHSKQNPAKKIETAPKKQMIICHGCEPGCSHCDVQGSSKKLIEYFQDIRKKKIDFHTQRFQSENTHQQKTTEMLDNFFISNEQFISSLLKEALLTQHQDQNEQSVTLNLTDNTLCGCVKQTELNGEHIIALLEEALAEVVNDDGDRGQQTKQKGMECSVLEENTLKNKDHSSFVNSKPFSSIESSGSPSGLVELDSSFFVGKPVRIFCTFDNKYHVGRIIDWRTQQPILDPSNYRLNLSVLKRKRCNEKKKNESTAVSQTSANVVSCSHQHHPSQKQDEMKNNPIPLSRAEFLVRFCAGVDGRKAAVHQWIVLEEHALSVGIALVRGYLGTLDSDEKWRPGQIMLRTALEMIPVREINIAGRLSQQQQENHHLRMETRPSLYAFTLFFGLTYHAVLRLQDRCVDFFSPSRQHYDPKLLEENLAIATTMACVEFEEQRRIREFHNLLVSRIGSCCSPVAVSNNQQSVDKIATARSPQKYSERRQKNSHKNELIRIIEKIKEKHFSWPFREPVDTVEVTDYLDIVKDPIDLSTMEKRIQKSSTDISYYKSKQTLYADLVRMVENCKLYNAKTTIYYDCAVSLEKFLPTLFQDLPKNDL